MGKAALPRMLALPSSRLPAGPPPPPAAAERPQPPHPARGAGRGAPPGKGCPQALPAGSPGRPRARRLLSPPPAAASPPPLRAQRPAVPPPQRPPPLPPPQTKGRCPRRGLEVGGGGEKDGAGRPGRAGSGSAAARRCSAPGPRLGAVPAGPQPGSPRHPSAGLGWAARWAGRAGGGLSHPSPAVASSPPGGPAARPCPSPPALSPLLLLLLLLPVGATGWAAQAGSTARQRKIFLKGPALFPLPVSQKALSIPNAQVWVLPALCPHNFPPPPKHPPSCLLLITYEAEPTAAPSVATSAQNPVSPTLLPRVLLPQLSPALTWDRGRTTV